MSSKLFVLLCVVCAVAAIPVPSEEQLKSIELLKIPLKGDKELDILTLGDEGTLKERNKRTIGVLRELFPELSKVIANEGDEQSQGDADSSQIDLIRVVRETAAAENAIDSKPEASENTDQKTAESKTPAIDDLALDSAEDEEKNHDKRFLDFNGGGSSGGSGGSGNFLFDIIRLVSGSSGTEKTDEEENAPDDDTDSETGKSGDGYTEGIPGPVTRLFVLANRGLSNLIQDLILRVAQTSERLVNFKARLITSLI